MVRSEWFLSSKEVREILLMAWQILRVECVQSYLLNTDFFFFQLVLRENDLISLPKEIGELTRLRELLIQGNRLTVLPPELGRLRVVFSPCPAD